MKMKCPHCGVSGAASQIPSSRLVKCPRCTEIFLIPEVVEFSESPPLQDPVPSPATEEGSAKDESIFVEQDSFDSFQDDATSPESIFDDALFPDGPAGEADEQIELGIPAEIPNAEDGDTQDISIGFENGGTAPEWTTSSGDIFALEEADDTDENIPVAEKADSVAEGSGDAEQIMLATEIEAEEASGDLDISVDSDELGDTVEWTQQFEEISESLEVYTEEASVDVEGQEEVIAEEFFEFDESSKEGFLDVDTPGSPSQTGISPEDSSEYIDFSENKITWKPDEQTILAESELEGEGTLGIDERLVVQPGEEEIQAELKELLTTTCITCDNKVEGDALYCRECIEKRGPDEDVAVSLSAAEDTPVESPLDDSAKPDGKKQAEIPTCSLGNEFSVGAILKEASVLTKGAKGAIWGGVIIMYLVVFFFAAAGFLLFELLGSSPDTQMIVLGGNAALEFANTVFSILFTAGLMNIGVRRVAGKDFSWRTAFSGFAKFGKVMIGGLLMTVMLGIGFLLLVLPGIYLMVGYSLALPLILDQDCGIWEAMERSRKAIHKKWWKVFGLYLIMYLIFMVSLIPLGLGIIWTVPMFFVLAGVLYRQLLTHPEVADS